MNTTLENLPSAVKENRLRNFAKNMVQYQNFKTSAIIKRIDNAGYTDVTLKMYINSCIAYIKHGTKIDKVAKDLYTYMDEFLKAKIQPLTPSEQDKRLTGNYRHQKVIPVQKTLEKIYKQVKPIYFGVQMNQNIRIYETQDEAKGFMDGLSFMGKTDVKLVKLSIEEID